MPICKNCDNDITKEIVRCIECNSPMHNECKAKCIKCHNPMCFNCSVDNKYTCNECKTVETYDMEFISSTMFESYEKCPFSFKQEFILKSVPEEFRQNKYSAIGTLLHGIFETYSMKDNLESLYKEMSSRFATEFDELSDDLFDGEADKDRYRNIAITTMNNWMHNERNMVKPFATEAQHFMELHPDLPKIRCTLDRINIVDDEYVVWDYKTGKIYSSDKLKSNLQLAIYAMAIHKLYGKYPKQLVLHFPQHDNALRIFERKTNDVYICKVHRGGTYTMSLDASLDRMIQIYKNIKAGKFECNTSNQNFCNTFCSIKKAGLCEGVITKWNTEKKRW